MQKIVDLEDSSDREIASRYVCDNHIEANYVNNAARTFMSQWLETKEQQGRNMVLNLRGKEIPMFPVKHKNNGRSYQPVNSPKIWWERTKMADIIPSGYDFEPTFAITPDSIQGRTLDSPLYVSKNIIRRGAFYTAVTRTRSLDNIHVVDIIDTPWVDNAATTDADGQMERSIESLQASEAWADDNEWILRADGKVMGKSFGSNHWNVYDSPPKFWYTARKIQDGVWVEVIMNKDVPRPSELAAAERSKNASRDAAASPENEPEYIEAPQYTWVIWPARAAQRTIYACTLNAKNQWKKLPEQPPIPTCQYIAMELVNNQWAKVVMMGEIRSSL
jgi:hypothetical protein